MKKKNIILIVIVILFTISVNAQSLIVEITGIRNRTGNICFAVFVDEAGFDKEQAYYEKNYSKSNIKNGKLTLRLKLKPGVYGISILDDENKDGEMRYNLIGVPKEGFGFSNYYHTGFKKPKFENFSFRISDKDKKVVVKMKYM